MARRRPSTVHGIAVVDKPAGVTSHDVVGMLRRRFDERRVGHAGTLDPDATGVLVIAVGNATRLLRFIEATTKQEGGCVCLFEARVKDESNGSGGDNFLAPLYPDSTEYTRFSSVMDSGASDNVTSGEDTPEAEVVPSPGSESGLTYGSASGDDIPNEGQQHLPLVTSDRLS